MCELQIALMIGKCKNHGTLIRNLAPKPIPENYEKQILEIINSIPQ